MIVLLSPYHDLHDPDATLPPAPPGLLSKLGHLLDLAVTATFENDFEQMRKINRRVSLGFSGLDHKEIEAALVGPEDWLTPGDIIRYRKNRVKELRDAGKEAAETTWKRIQEHGWDSLKG
jgi:hypothetical protein